MKVLVAGGMPSSLTNFRFNLLCDMQDRGCEVLTCAQGEDPETEARLAERGIRYIPTALQRHGTSLKDDRAYWKQFREILKAERPDKLLSYTIKPVIYGGLAAKGLTDYTAMITGLGYAFSGGGFKRKAVNLVVRRLYKAAFKNASSVIFQNDEDRALFDQLGLTAPTGRAEVVAGSGVDLTRFPRVPLPEGPMTFLLMARLLKGKGIYDYVEAARIIRAKYPDTRFILVGWSDENPEAVPETVAEGWAREGLIEFWGRKDDVRPALAACHVFVLPSFYREGTPRTILEAFATGRTVVTCDTPGCRQTVVPGEVGTLVPPQNPVALAVALEAYILNPQRVADEGDAAYRRAQNVYDVRAVNRAILAVMGIG